MDSSRIARAGTVSGWLITLLGLLTPGPALAGSADAVQDPYIEDFSDGDATGWQPLSGTWSAASQVYTNAAVVPTAITRSPLGGIWDVQQAAADLAYTFKVRILNPYSGSGNLVGVAWVRNAGSYTEAVFSPTGQARLNSVSNGVRSTIASASYVGGGRNKWFEVEIGNDGNDAHQAAHIKVNGVPVFDVAPNVREGELSLITHWAPGRFDDVRAAARFFTPFFENFDDGAAPQFATAGTWSAQDDMFTSTAVVKAGRAFVQETAGWHDLADFELRARVLNRFGSSGNLVGFTYGARGSVYYEAVFGPTGVAHLRKVVNDVPSSIATAHYQGGARGQRFDAQLIQRDRRTTVLVNGVTVFNNVLQPDAVGGELGFVTHWTSASVDDVSFAQIPITRYRYTRLPSLTNLLASENQVRALNDRGEAVGWSLNANRRATAVLWRGGRVIDLGVNSSDSSFANDINNKSEIAGQLSGSVAFSWKDGQLRVLEALPDIRGWDAEGINERGQIAGQGCIDGDGCRALLWEPDGRFTALAALVIEPGPPRFELAQAINEHGEIVGFSTDSVSTLDAVSWQGDTVESLGIRGIPSDINNRGQIVGQALLGYQRAVMWQEHELVVLPTRVGENFGAAEGINEHGVIVGSTITASDEVSATLWQEGRAVDLNELLVCNPLPESIELTVATDINERGEIAAGGFDLSRSTQAAFVLTPVSGRESCDP